MGRDATTISDGRQPDGWQYDESNSDVTDGRLSAIMPRKLFQDDAAVKSGLLQVYVRMKPVPVDIDTCMVLDDRQMLKATWRNTEAVYKFSKVFQTDADQEAVYNGTTASLVEDLLHFRQPSAVVMAYGVTSAGKTFTMQGTADRPGLVPQALKDIFQALGGGSRKDDRVSLSVCEIYNESIHDLLAPAHQRAKPMALRLKEDKCGNITVVGAAQLPVHSAKEALELLRRAAKARQCAETGVNEHSSRSHAVITIKLHTSVQESCQAYDAAGKQSYLHFVDLAGCERVKRTGNSGARLRESVAINSSLMTLARCLEVLRYNQQHAGDQKVIPYRESKITHLFKGVLHGSGRFVMVVNVSPASEAFNETKRVLQYAALASKVNMTSEIEHDIAGETWPTAHNLPREAAGQLASATDAATAAAVSAALVAAQTRIEELLDDKADLEYEIDVVERKVELLREELIKSEVEKEQLEADIRAEVQEEMQELMQQATAKERDRALQAETEATAWKQKAVELERLLEQQREQMKKHVAEQQQLKELQLALEQQKQAKHAVLPLSEHQLLLQEANDAAAATAAQQQAEHNAQVAQLELQHNQQVAQLQRQLSAAQAEADTLHQQHMSAAPTAQQQFTAAEAFSRQQLADLQQLVVGAFQLVQHVVGQQQQGAAEMQELTAAAQQVHLTWQLQQTHQRQHRRQQDGKSPAAAAAAGATNPMLVIIDPFAVADVEQQLQVVSSQHNAESAGEQEAATMLPCLDAEQQQQIQQQQTQQPRPQRTRHVTIASHAGAPAALKHAQPDADDIPQLAAASGRRSRRCTLASSLPPLQEEEPVAVAAEAQSPTGQAAAHDQQAEVGAVPGAVPGAVVPAGGVGGSKKRRRTIAPAAAAQAGEPLAASGRQRSSRRHSLNQGSSLHSDKAAAAAAAPVAAANVSLLEQQLAADAGQKTAITGKLTEADMNEGTEQQQQQPLQQVEAAQTAAVPGCVKRRSRRQTVGPCNTFGTNLGPGAAEDVALQPSPESPEGGIVWHRNGNQALLVIQEEEEDTVLEACAAAATAIMPTVREDDDDGDADGCKDTAAQRQQQAAASAAAAAPSRKRRRAAEDLPAIGEQSHAAAEGTEAGSSPKQQHSRQQLGEGSGQKDNRRKRRKTGTTLEQQTQQAEQHQPDVQAAQYHQQEQQQRRQTGRDDSELMAADVGESAGHTGPGAAADAEPPREPGFVAGAAPRAAATNKVCKASRTTAAGAGRTRRVKHVSALHQELQPQRQQQGSKQDQTQLPPRPEQHGVVDVEPPPQLPAALASAPSRRKERAKHNTIKCGGTAGAQTAATADEMQGVNWWSADHVLQDVTQQQLRQAVGRRATYAAAGKACAATTSGQNKQCGKQQLPHIAGGITPVAYRTRHRGAK